MKILLLADEEAAKFYDYYKPGMFDPYDVIISCGDLHREYLEFIVTMSGKPLLYVHGNHDDSYRENPPGGCICIEDRIFVYKGIRFMGLGGSLRYRKDGINMYTESEMRSRIRRLWWRLKRHRGVDIIVTHAPPHGFGDMDDLPHRGFKSFVKLLDQYSPTFLVHGHIHGNYGILMPKTQEYKDTLIVNAWQFAEIEIPDREQM
ncbi:MAG: metallophosphoesterase [Lachnospiraceae bacterium]|nr:metallophosphoesterase [Lachnospiraceae bacterium]